jgi:hypothetical protein
VSGLPNPAYTVSEPAQEQELNEAALTHLAQERPATRHPDVQTGWRFRSEFFDRRPVLILALLTPLVFLVNGYHPSADDGAIYAEGIKKLVDPNLYRSDAVFVQSHTRFSIFAHLLAGVVRYGSISLPDLLLACQVLSIFLFLLGCSRVARKIFAEPLSQWGAVLLGACCFTLPVAGTSLFIMDPYVTARSFSTPLSLFALAAVLGGAWVEAALWLALATLVHPLMAGFAAIFLVMLALAERRMWRSIAAFASLGFVGSAAIFWATRSVPLDLAYSQAALSRSYFFLSTWEWYEYPGIFFPLLLMLIAAWRSRAKSAVSSLSIASTAVGACALLVALCFVHRGGSLMLARLQVLRTFHIIYVVGVLLAGGMLGSLTRNRFWYAVYCVVLGAIFAGQMLTYPASNHVEWPGLLPRNQWEQAFQWIRANTPENAVFAMDAGYIEDPGEDSQGFRAVAERSALADWYKDGGVASIFPAAAEPWWRELQATRGVDRTTDQEREARLTPLGATWILLPVQASTAFPCPYRNRAVRVCRLRAYY